jgi:hypothetical protein
MTQNNMNSDLYVMPDDIALGFFDADGCVLIGTDFKLSSSGKKALSYKVVYLVNQSLSKQETVEKFAEKFDGKKCLNSGEFRANQSSAVGLKVRQFLLKNKPKHPYRLRDFLLSEKVITLLNTESNNVRQIAIAYLASRKSVFITQGGVQEFFTKCCLHIQATQDEIQQGVSIGEPMVAEIEKNHETCFQILSAIELSDDYVLGTHYGDGSFYIALSWKPTGKAHRLRCEPEWSVSGDNENYCKAFANAFNGKTVRVDAKGQIKFVLSGVEKCLSILPLFDRALWMPEYKKEQYERWKTSINLIYNQEHFTQEGIVRLLDLTYGLAEKGGRKYPKEQYLEWGLAWLNNPTRQKRKPRRKT